MLIVYLTFNHGKKLITTNNAQISQITTSSIVDFLDKLGLPSDNIIADDAERRIINQNLQSYLETLPEEVKRDAR